MNGVKTKQQQCKSAVWLLCKGGWNTKVWKFIFLNGDFMIYKLGYVLKQEPYLGLKIKHNTCGDNKLVAMFCNKEGSHRVHRTPRECATVASVHRTLALVILRFGPPPLITPPPQCFIAIYSRRRGSYKPFYRKTRISSPAGLQSVSPCLWLV